MWQQILDPARGLRRQPDQYVLEVGVRMCPLSLAECSRLMTAAARCPARSEPANHPFDLPMAIGLIWSSAQLLSAGRSPSSMKRVSASQRFKLWSMASAVAEP